MKEKILELMNNEKYYPLTIHQIYQKLNLSTSEEFIELVKTINQLENEYIIIHLENDTFGILEKCGYTKGIIDVKESGFGFVISPMGDIFVPEKYTGSAVNLDEVLITFKTDKQKRLEGKVVKIIKRNTEEIVGVIETKFKKLVVKSIDKKINILVFIKDNKKLEIGTVVRVKIDRYYNNHTADGHVIKIIGSSKEVGMDITTLIENANVITEFSEDTIEYVKSLPLEINKQDYPNRKDLTNELIITIDGDDAKDYDDAVKVEKLNNGNYLLGVYIADVSEYVKEQTSIDFDAFNRGTSIYLPDRVINMLPKELSNGLCSLNENVDRLVMACEMEINEQGKVESYQIFEGIIKSHHRMTYNNVNKILEDNDEELINKYQDIYPMLKDMENLSKILYNMRLERGAFEFSSSEAKLILNDKGQVEDIQIRTQKTAENLIEEFMLIANETVSESMTWLDVPFIYRVHDEPVEEKINNFLTMMASIGYDVKIKNKKSLPKILQSILLDINNNEETEKAVINQMLLRSMSKAKYQELNIGHFGLASKCYTHFTSPIRRYPDLLVHRLVKHYMLNNKQINYENDYEYFQNKVHETGIISSLMERKAENLERECVKLKLVQYMEKFIGYKYEGVISSVVNFGIFISINEVIEGLVSYEDMNDFEYDVNQGLGYVTCYPSKKIFRIGEKVIVKVISVNVKKKEINLKILRKVKE